MKLRQFEALDSRIRLARRLARIVLAGVEKGEGVAIPAANAVAALDEVVEILDREKPPKKEWRRS